MSKVLLNNESFDSNTIKVIQRRKDEQGYYLEFYCNMIDIGMRFTIYFEDLLKDDDLASSIAYKQIVNLLVAKQDGLIDLESIIRMTSKLYRETIVICSDIHKHLLVDNKIKEFRDIVVKEYTSNLTKLIRNLIVQ